MQYIQYNYLECDVVRRYTYDEYRTKYHCNNRRLAESIVKDNLIELYPDIEVFASFLTKYNCVEDGLDFQIRTYLVRTYSENDNYQQCFIVRAHINYDLEQVSFYCFAI